MTGTPPCGAGFPLPSGTPETDIKHVRRLAIFIKANGNFVDAASKLTFHIANDDENNAGRELQENETPDTVIEEYVDRGSQLVGRGGGPLDFSIAKKCYIVLKLEGDFWEFNLDCGVSTKLDLKGRYYELVPHSRKGRVVAISFCARAPEPENLADLVRHAINLHVDFLDHGGTGGTLRRLPVIIDPDVENRGG